MSDEAESALDDLFSGKDRFLTSGEVAELLNVNTNTLYLWRQSGDVDLPFHRFIAPGQSRGMIRYKYSDVARFIQRAETMGRVFIPEDDSESTERMETILKKQKGLSSKQKKRAKKERERELSRPLEELIEEALPKEKTTSSKADDIIKQLLEQYGAD